jgi:hypothetical protein
MSVSRSGGLAHRLFEVERFPPGVVGADKDSRQDDGRANFHEDFTAVKPVDRVMLQVGVGKKRVPEKCDRAEVDGEVESFPELPPELDAEIRSDHHERDDVESDSADGIFQGLLRGVNRIDDVEDAKSWVFIEEQDDRMQCREQESDIAGPVVQRKIIEAPMRPVAHRAIPENHQHAQQHVNRDGAYRDQPEVSRKVEGRDVHRVTAPRRRVSGVGLIFV